MSTDLSGVSPPSASAVRQRLEAHGLRANKALGQNFLVNSRVVQTIIDAVAPDESDLIVEIGPGLGALTYGLAARAGKVAAVEIDRGLAAALETGLHAAGAANTTVIAQNFLDVDLSGFRAWPGRVKIVGNLPYYATSRLLRALLAPGAALSPDCIVVMMQREVARKLSATPGTAGFGPLALLADYRARVESVAVVSPDCFFPQPGVFSEVVKLAFRERPPVESNGAELFKLVDAAFATRRKTLRNCLASAYGISREQAARAIEACGLTPDIRGEALRLEDFDALCRIIATPPGRH